MGAFNFVEGECLLDVCVVCSCCCNWCWHRAAATSPLSLLALTKMYVGGFKNWSTIIGNAKLGEKIRSEQF